MTRGGGETNFCACQVCTHAQQHHKHKFAVVGENNSVATSSRINYSCDREQRAVPRDILLGEGGGGGTLVGDNVVLKILFQTFSDLNFSEKSLIFNIFLNSSFLGAPLGMLGLLFYFSVGILHPLTPASSSGPALTNNSRNSWKVDEKCDHCSPQHQSTKMSVFLNSDRTRNLRHHNVTICAQPL